jgi:hypothetical protein
MMNSESNKRHTPRVVGAVVFQYEYQDVGQRQLYLSWERENARYIMLTMGICDTAHISCSKCAILQQMQIRHDCVVTFHVLWFQSLRMQALIELNYVYFL